MTNLWINNINYIHIWCDEGYFYNDHSTSPVVDCNTTVTECPVCPECPVSLECRGMPILIGGCTCLYPIY